MTFPVDWIISPVVGRNSAEVVYVARQQDVDAVHQVERLLQPLPAGVLGISHMVSHMVSVS